MRLVSTQGESLEIRKDLDVNLAKTPGVDFIISCLTGTQNNKKSKKANEDGEESVIKKGVAYFIVVRQSSVEDEVRRVISNAGYQSTLNYICPRGVDRNSTDRSLKMLKGVMKV